MPMMPAWQEIESKVHHPEIGFVSLTGGVFLLIGGFALLTFDGAASPILLLLTRLGLGLFLFFGASLVAWAIHLIVWPKHVRHATPDVLPGVPREPVMEEGSTVRGHLDYELTETAGVWEFRPKPSVWRNDKRFLIGFGVPFAVLFSGLLAWQFHRHPQVGGWPLATVLAIAITTIAGGTTFGIIGMILRYEYLRLAKLTIPRDSGDLVLESAEGLTLLDPDDTKKQRRTIPRATIVAVQLCPWKHVVAGPAGGRIIGCAVQGLLVLAATENEAIARIPILLTSDLGGAAQILQRLANTLQVPYLFSGDRTGWKEELTRAKHRPPLRSGGQTS